MLTNRFTNEPARHQVCSGLFSYTSPSGSSLLQLKFIRALSSIQLFSYLAHEMSEQGGVETAEQCLKVLTIYLYRQTAP